MMGFIHKSPPTSTELNFGPPPLTSFSFEKKGPLTSFFYLLQFGPYIMIALLRGKLPIYLWNFINTLSNCKIFLVLLYMLKDFKFGVLYMFEIAPAHKL